MTIFPFSAHIMTQPLPMGSVEMDQEKHFTSLYLSKQQKHDKLPSLLDDHEQHTTKNNIYQVLRSKLFRRS